MISKKAKLSEALKEIAKTKKQTFTELANFDYRSRKPKSYCLVGALACQKGMIKSEEQMQRDFGDTLSYSKILDEYGITRESMSKNYLKYVPEDLFGPLSSNYRWHPKDSVNLSTILWWLNDSSKITFARAAELVESWERKGIIEYE